MDPLRADPDTGQRARVHPAGHPHGRLGQPEPSAGECLGRSVGRAVRVGQLPPQLRRQGECGSSAAPGAAAPKDPGTPVGSIVLVVLAALLLLALLLLPLFWRVRVRTRRLNSSAGRTPHGCDGQNAGGLAGDH